MNELSAPSQHCIVWKKLYFISPIYLGPLSICKGRLGPTPPRVGRDMVVILLYPVRQE